MPNIKVIQVVSGLEIHHGGPSYSVPRLNDALNAAGIDSVVFTDLTPGDCANDSKETIVSFNRRFGRWPFLGKLHISGEMRRCLLDRSNTLDLLHSHGLWRMPNIYAARAARHKSIPHMISPRGMLSSVALNFSRRGKNFFWHAVQKSALYESDCLHATSASELEEIRALGIRQPVAVVPNGVDFPAPPQESASPGDHTDSARTLLYFGRIHPKKGVHTLIAAWARLAADFPDWCVRIVGPAEPEHRQALEQLVAHRRLPRVSLEEAVYGQEKWHLYREADVFVLPTLNENFGLTVAESLACKCPVIVTRGAPWPGVEKHACGWWINVGEQALVEALRVALQTSPGELREMGARGEAWARRAFSWDSIGLEMASVYSWLLGDAKPTCIEIA